MKTPQAVEMPVQDRESVLTDLYLELFPPVARYISRRGGNLEEARDIFQQSLLIYYEKIRAWNPELIPQNANAYVMGIAKHLWAKRFREMNVFSNQPSDEIELPDEKALTASENQLLVFLQKAGSRCLNMLQAFYYEKMNMEKIASAFGFSSARSATVQKYKCLEKVRNELRKNKMSYEDFTE